MVMENISPTSCPFYNSIADLIKTNFSDWSTSILYRNLAKQFFYKSEGEGWPTILQLMKPMHTYKQVTAYLGCDAGVPTS